MMVRVLLFVPFAALMVAPAIAQSPSDAPKAAAPVKEKLVCEDEEQIGSRLGHHRVCKTAAQWADERREARMLIDRSQMRHCSNGSAGC